MEFYIFPSITFNVWANTKRDGTQIIKKRLLEPETEQGKKVLSQYAECSS